MEIQNRHGERGSARLKLLLVIIVIAIVAYAGYVYIPVSYNAYLFKDLMQQKVNTAPPLTLAKVEGISRQYPTLGVAKQKEGAALNAAPLVF